MAGPAIDAGLVPTVTPQAPPHLETGYAGDPIHGGHLAVAGAACELGADMHHVRKIDKVRQGVDPDPRDWLPPVPVPHQFPDLRSIGRDELVACPAVSHCRDTCHRRTCGKAVAEQARDGVCAGVQFVAEVDRLERRTFPQVQRQDVYKCQTGGYNTNYNDHKYAGKPRFFHTDHQGAADINGARNVACSLRFSFHPEFQDGYCLF